MSDTLREAVQRLRDEYDARPKIQTTFGSFADRLDVILAAHPMHPDPEPTGDEASDLDAIAEVYCQAGIDGGMLARALESAGWRRPTVTAPSGLHVIGGCTKDHLTDGAGCVATRSSQPAAGERDATPDEAHDIGYSKGHIDGYREAKAESTQPITVSDEAEWTAAQALYIASQRINGFDVPWSELGPAQRGSWRNMARAVLVAAAEVGR